MTKLMFKCLAINVNRYANALNPIVLAGFLTESTRNAKRADNMSICQPFFKIRICSPCLLAAHYNAVAVLELQVTGVLAV